MLEKNEMLNGGGGETSTVTLSDNTSEQIETLNALGPMNGQPQPFINGEERAMDGDKDISTNIRSGNRDFENCNSGHMTFIEGDETANLQIEQEESNLACSKESWSSNANGNGNDDDKDGEPLSSELEIEDIGEGGDEDDEEPEAGEEDVDFDNFGQMTVEENIDEEAVLSKDLETSTHDDDFGDFGDFSAISTVRVAPIEENKILNHELESLDINISKDADEFGDFETPAQEKIIQSGDVADDDLGDFGDFDTIPMTVQSDVLSREETEDEFGDFGEFNEASEPNKVVEVVPRRDSFVTKARSVFGDVFASDRLEREQHLVESEESSSSMKLNLVLNEINSTSKSFRENEGLLQEKPMAADWAMESLTTMLLPGNISIIQESSNTLIFDRNACHRQSRYSSLFFAETPKSMEMIQSPEHRQRSDQKSPTAPEIAEVSDSNNIRDDENDEVNLQNDSQFSSEAFPSIDVKLDFSDFKAPTEKDVSGIAGEQSKQRRTLAKKDSIAAKAQLFLKEVPDLSFMLSAKMLLMKR